ncbi:MAG: GntR family transcriptional regulator [Caldicoprobacterales bacterium]|nr:GntR family transcriptional regulator [Clostridia bacterium]MDI9512182.1 GntR family transcriptional regulator [Bacillota bacterium]NLH58887.1 GntR family transcriptional regulator [Clostridiales bacterium]
MRIVLSYQSSIPIYEQIKEQIKASILSGELAEGMQLPSIRQLARDLKVSVITTTRAYSDLELEGFLQTVPGKGSYVKGIDSDLVKAKYLNETKDVLASAIKLGKMAGLTLEDLHKLLDELEATHSE